MNSETTKRNAGRFGRKVLEGAGAGAGGKSCAVLYARVSSSDQEKEGFSIPAQQRLLREYATANNIVVMEEFVDVETAKATGRTGFAKMLAFLKQNRKRVRAILVEKTDRLYRNIKDWSTLDEFGVSIHFVKEGTIIGPDSRSSDQFVHGIKVLMARNYSLNLSEETVKGMTEKARAGIYPSQAPFGYWNVDGPNGKRVVEPHPTDAPVVARLFDLFATGHYSLQGLTAHTRNIELMMRGKKFVTSTLQQILRRRMYMGEFEWNGVVYKGVHEPLVSRDTWTIVQEILDGRRNNHTGPVRLEFPFTGLVTCGHCGCSMVAELKKGKYVYYHCTGKRGKCPEPYTRQELLVNEFAAVLGELVIPEEILNWLADAVNGSDTTETKARENALKSKAAEIERLNHKLSTLYDDRLEGRITGAFYDQKAAQIESQQSDLRRSIAELENATLPPLTTAVELARLTSHACTAFRDQEEPEQRKLLAMVLKNSSWKDGQLQANLFEPFELVRRSNRATGNLFNGLPAQKGGFEIWLPDMGSNHDSRRQRPVSYH